MKNDIIFSNIKPIFSGHETFSLRYGWLKKFYDSLQKKIDPYDETEEIINMGVGKNMLSSMKYWAKVTSLLDKNNKINPEFDKILKDDGLDPWLENINTLWFIHYQLATNSSLFIYYVFFNYFNGSRFSKNDFKVFIEKLYQTLKNKKYKYFQIEITENTLERDIECLFKLYSNENTKDSYEELINSPLAELSLIDIIKKDVYSIKYKYKNQLSIYTFVYTLLIFWFNYSAYSKTISFEAISNEPLSPGRLFLLDENSIYEYIYQIRNNEEWKNVFTWSETSGLRLLYLDDSINFSTMEDCKKIAFKFFEKNYERTK